MQLLHKVSGWKRAWEFWQIFCGNDSYHANDNSQGFSTPSKTEDIIGIGMLIDNQGNQDIFHDSLQENLLLYRPNGGPLLNK